MSSIYTFTDKFGTHHINLKKIIRIVVSNDGSNMNLIFNETEEGFLSLKYDENLIKEFKEQ